MNPFSMVLAVLGVSAAAAHAQQHAPAPFKTQRLSDVFFGEGATVGDFNRDGKTDVASGPYWYAGPDFETRREIYKPKPFNKKGYSDNFFAFAADFNGDGWEDVLVYGFPGKDASWFENTQGQAGHWPRHKVLDVVDNESPTFVDLTGDGKAEIVCSSGGFFGYAEPHGADPTKPWAFRKISTKSAGGRFTHGLGVGDVNGDGKPDLLEKNGWWENPGDAGSDVVWKHHKTWFGNGGAQMYAYDVDGDGDNDVITSLQAHAYGLAWFEQEQKDGKIAFTRHDIMGDKPEQNRFGLAFSQLHAIDLVDMDGDGLKDIVTGKRHWAHNGNDPGGNDPAVLYWFKLTRQEKGAAGVEFVPQKIHGDSGIGVQVLAADVNGDQLPDVVVGNKKGTWVHIQSRKKVSEGEWRKAQPRPARAKAAGPPESKQEKNRLTVQIVGASERADKACVFGPDDVQLKPAG